MQKNRRLILAFRIAAIVVLLAGCARGERTHLWLPVGGDVRTSAGTYETTLVIENRSGDAGEAVVTFTSGGRALQLRGKLLLAPREVRSVTIAELFGRSDVLGGVMLQSRLPLAATARVTLTEDDGSRRQVALFPARAANDALRVGEEVRFRGVAPKLTLYVAEASGAGAHLAVQLLDAAGRVVAEEPHFIGAGSYLAINPFSGQLAADRSSTVVARVFAGRGRVMVTMARTDPRTRGVAVAGGENVRERQGVSIAWSALVIAVAAGMMLRGE